jgi:hypothetical protein
MTTFTRKGHEGVRFFIGPEVEQTAAFNKKTLFVVGLQDTVLIRKLADENNIKHIFLSANRSFDSVDKVNGVYMVGDTLASSWEKQILILLAANYMVSLDYPAHKHAMLLEILHPSIWQSRSFVPILSVAIPHVNTSSVNLTVKIDDINFGATNPGVWCINHHELTDSNRFTGWGEYGDDVIIDVARSEAAKFTESDRRVYTVDVGDMDADQALEAVTAAMKDATLNDTSLGLDPAAKSALKADPDALPGAEALAAVMPATPAAAADAYAEGATVDPLSAKESTKPAAAKPAKPVAKAATKAK